MKVKILKYITKETTNMMIDLKPNQILNLDEEVAKNLIEKGAAEIAL